MSDPLLKRLLVEYDTKLADELIQNKIVAHVRKLIDRNEALGISDLFLYMCQHVLSPTCPFEYKMMLILIWASVYPDFCSDLMEKEELRHLEPKLQQMCQTHACGMRLDGKPFPSGKTATAQQMKSYLRTTGYFVYTFRNVYLAHF